MSIRRTAMVICLFFIFCTFLLNNVQGCGGSFWAKSQGWHTEYRHSFSKRCPNKGDTISNVQSVHDDYYEDRVWHFKCHSNSRTTSLCAWSQPHNVYLNRHDENVEFYCPRNGYINGMYGRGHNNHYNDRQFDFSCCDGVRPRRNCKWTSYVNNWDGRMNYRVEYGYEIAGVYSTHHNHYEDRRWKFYICQ